MPVNEMLCVNGVHTIVKANPYYDAACGRDSMAVTWRRRVWAGVLAGWGLGVMCLAPSRRHALAMGAFLLIAWLEAFVPRAPLFQPLGKTIEGYRRGTYPAPSTLDTLVAMGSFALMVAAVLVPD